MTWVCLESSLPTHPKIIRAGKMAVAAWVFLLCWTRDRSTDGVISREVALLFANEEELRKLVEVRLLDAHPDGYRIHDFADWNRTAEEEQARREELSRKRADAGAKGNAVRWGSHRKTIAKASQVGSQKGSQNDGKEGVWPLEMPERASDEGSHRKTIAKPSQTNRKAIARSPDLRISGSEIPDPDLPSVDLVPLADATGPRETSRELDGQSEAPPPSDNFPETWTELPPTAESGVHRIAPPRAPSTLPPPAANAEPPPAANAEPPPPAASWPTCDDQGTGRPSVAPPPLNPPPRASQTLLIADDDRKLAKTRGRRMPPPTAVTPPPEGYQAVIDAYFVAFERAKGEKPVFLTRTGSAAKRLLAAMPVPDAIATIDKAFADAWFVKTKGELWDIAAEPNKYRGNGPKVTPIRGGNRLPLQAVNDMYSPGSPNFRGRLVTG